MSQPRRRAVYFPALGCRRGRTSSPRSTRRRARSSTRRRASSALPFDRLRGVLRHRARADGTAYLANFGRGTACCTRHADGGWTVDDVAVQPLRSRRRPASRCRIPTASPGSAGSEQFVRFDLTGGRRAADGAFPVLVRRVTAGQDRVLFAGAGAAADRPGCRRRRRRAALRVRGADVPRRDRHRVPDAARRPRRRLVAVDARDAPRLHQSRLRRLPVPRPGAQRRRHGQRGGDLRLHDPAAVVPHVVGVSGLSAARRRAWSSGVDRLQRRRLLGKERERAQFAEARLRAEAAEALARTESEGKKQVELLSDIGREITASLDFDTIFGKLYERVNQLADADVFGVGLYHPERKQIEYRLAIEEGKRYAPYTRDTSDPDQLPVWCIEHRQPVFINDLARRLQAVRQPTTTRRASGSKTARCRRRRSRSSTCRSRPRTACSASSPSRASRRTPTPSIT